MPIPTKEERIEFWKHAYARASFVDARIFAEQVLAAGLPLQHPVRKALSIAVLTTYCRPFKQRPVVRLADTVVPAAFADLHESLIEMRDKVVAHRDLDGPVADWGFVSQLEIAVDEGGLEIRTRSPVVLDAKARELLPLLDVLIGQMDAKVDQFVQQHLAALIRDPGVHVLQIDGDPNAWTTRINQRAGGDQAGG